MTVLTTPLTNTIERASHLFNLRQTMDQMNKVVVQLNALARKEGFSTAFTDGGDVITTIPTAGELTATYNNLREQVEAGEHDRETVMKALKVGAGAVVGAAVGGLLWREANRRRLPVKAMRAFNRVAIPRLIAKHYGKLAEKAARLAMDKKIDEVRIVSLSGKKTTRPGQVILTNDGLTQKQGDDVRTLIPFESIVEIEEVIDATGKSQVTLVIADDAPAPAAPANTAKKKKSPIPTA